MRHIAATRLADLAAGTLNDGAREKVQSHLQECQVCMASLARIETSRSAMADIKDAEAPELGWDSIAARIYWSTSSEQRAKVRKSSNGWQLPAFGAAALAAAAALGVWTFAGNEGAANAPQPDSPQVAVAAPTAPIAPIAPTAPVVRVAEALSAGLITFAQGDVRLDDKPVHFDHEVVAGTRLPAGEGGLVVQFGDQSAFRLAANSTLEVRRFDALVHNSDRGR